MIISLPEFIPVEQGAESIDFNVEFYYSVTSGSLSQFTSVVEREQDAGAYDYFQAFDRSTMRLLREIRNKRLLKTIKVDDLLSATDQDLLYLVETVGLEYFENYIYDAFKQRALIWAENVSGGTPQTIKRSLYYYIGSGAFPVNYNPDTGDRIIINDIVALASSGAVWGTTAGSTTGEAPWGEFEWGTQDAINQENFKVTIYFNNSGDSTDRNTHQYWELDANRVSLNRIIDQVRSAGLINTLEILAGY